jgi:hypothetical protein
MKLDIKYKLEPVRFFLTYGKVYTQIIYIHELIHIDLQEFKGDTIVHYYSPISSNHMSFNLTRIVENEI